MKVLLAALGLLTAIGALLAPMLGRISELEDEIEGIHE